ncbi:MAG: ChbG/HpnK family deacetylase [Myxococcota bacterium]
MSRRLVLNADDFGYDPAVTRGIVEAMTKGVVSSTTMIVNSPFSGDAAAHAESLSIGLHLNLVRFEALSERGRVLEERALPTLTADFVAHETEAQLARLVALLGRRPTHIDVHKHAHLASNVLDGVARTAKAWGLKVRSISDEMRAALRAKGVETNDAFLGDAGAEAYWTPARFEAQLDALPADGLVELMCHPGYRPSHVQSGYGPQREVELATFVDPRAKAALEQRGLVFEGWA